MFKLIKGLMLKYHEAVAYLIFGVLTTVVNYAVYLAWTYAFPGKTANMTATAAAWVVSVLFAYFTNRKWVFHSAVTGLAPKLRECAAFFGGRAFTGLVDLGIMYLAVDILRFDGRVMKLISNVLVIILNYIMSKLIIFKKRT